MSFESIEQHLAQLPNVTTSENFGYKFFLYAEEQMLPFTTIALSDNEYDKVSNLNRGGIFRINIGVSRDTFRTLFSDDKKDWDYTELNRFMPHPDYAAQSFICVLNPEGENLEKTFRFIDEAYEIAKSRFERKQKTS